MLLFDPCAGVIFRAATQMRELECAGSGDEQSQNAAREQTPQTFAQQKVCFRLDFKMFNKIRKKKPQAAARGFG